jgi:membrane-bound serine protease (ClpP class)
MFDPSSEYFQAVVWVVAVLFVVAGIFFAGVLSRLLRGRRRRPTTGVEGMIGEVGEVRESIVGDEFPGWVFVHGERWRAVAEENGKRPRVIGVGDRVEVVGFQRGTVVVRPVEAGTTGTEAE